MTDDELRAIENRTNHATPGPWHYDSYHTIFACSGDDTRDICTVPVREHSDNAEYIAHTREDIPTLIAEIDRLKKEVDRAWIEGVEAGHND